MSTRREFLKTVVGGGIALSAVKLPWLAGCSHGGTTERQPLVIPDEFAGGMLVASVLSATSSGLGTQPWTLGGRTPAPTIRVRKADMFSTQLVNNLAEPTNIHWHGVLVPADMDGHPKEPVAAGGSRMFSYQVQNRAGTYWYHPHPHQATGKQVYLGMAGFFIVNDSEEQALGLPAGAFDVPLLIQDRRLASGSPGYAFQPMDIPNGYLGDTITVNGVPNAYFEVATGLYRFRLLNGANARIFRLQFADGRPLVVIATDGGLLEAPVTTDSLWLGPGERAEILVDFSKDPIGSSLLLHSIEFGMGGPTGGGGHAGHGGSTSTVPPQGADVDIIRFDVKRAAASGGSIPTKLATLEKLDPGTASKTRTFELAMRQGVTTGLHTINNLLFDLARMDEQLAAQAIEIWEFKSLDDGNIHPMHVHGMQFQVISRSSGPLNANDMGWKDTVLVFPMETVRVVARVSSYPGMYLLHCHTLEHEDDGMMINLQVT
ncbi:multicopper oxidase family protein [Haliangium sp. UPWRP_2]|uniref:multicopper oxidase family protein n=1 Tax=Haliangium sp. UPWRP_2 TaxID=1931276 RepID=UPI000B540794|nr:multicopper oxidase family protein [Haliangium sp. UPWRP_2]PSM31359.1 multicopper oxidase family protein [Haliangium sp. UPWRP_2]